MHSKGTRVFRDRQKNELRPLKNEEARYLFAEYKWFIPVSSKICRKCCKEFAIISKLRGISLEEFTTPNYKPVTLAFAQMPSNFEPSAPPFEDDNSISRSLSTDSSSTDVSVASKDWILTSPHLQSYKKEALDRLLFLNETYPKDPSVLESPWESVDPRRHRQIKDYAAAGIASVIHTVSIIENDVKIWSLMKKERNVEKYLKSSVTPSGFMKEMIKAWSGAGSASERYQIGSLIAMQYPYRYVMLKIKICNES